ncbi:MAG: DNRLRE domain-containing protein [Myxococcota bacterium]|nr:DNRLRE domain-containing protein [Myxococcota bacterium]
MPRSPRPFLTAVFLGTSAGVAACVPSQQMCRFEVDCGALASCLAGRCVVHGTTPAIAQSRRLLFAPVDLAYLDGRAQAITEGIATLGSARAGRGVALLRFSVGLPPETTVLEAYLVLERATAIDADPAPVSLHAARVGERWDGRWVSWGRQPLIEEVGAPVTRVSPSAGPLVRLDVREIVRRWRSRRGDDFGIAVLASHDSPTGIAFALSPSPGLQRDGPGRPSSQAGSADIDPSSPPIFGPRLELYVK